MRHAVAESIIPFDLRVQDRIGFWAEIRTGELGALRLVDISAPSSEAVRDPRVIRRWDPEVSSIHLQVYGHPVMEQDGRQVRLAPGDMTLVDLSRPTRAAGSAWRQISLVVPRSLLPLSHRQIRDVSGVVLSGREGTGALVASLARRIAVDLDAFAGAGAVRIGSALLDLVTAAISAWTGGPASHSEVALLHRIEAFIEQRLFDPSLAPGVVAAAHHMSLRRLHRLFERRRVWRRSSEPGGWSGAGVTCPIRGWPRCSARMRRP
jgi:hypothetical protein